jgi:hypothetical protein
MMPGCFLRANPVRIPLLRSVPIKLLCQVGFYLLCTLATGASIQSGSSRGGTPREAAYSRLL